MLKFNLNRATLLPALLPAPSCRFCNLGWFTSFHQSESVFAQTGDWVHRHCPAQMPLSVANPEIGR